MPDFLMPSLGADMDAGTLVEHRKAVGERVARGEVIAAVETDKGVIEIESFHDGVVESWVVPIGSRVPVGTRLAVLAEGPGAATTAQPVSEPETARAVPTAAALPVASTPVASIPIAPAPPPVAPSPVQPPPAEQELAMPPSARRRARELGVDPHDVHGTGRHGTITRDDVERAAHPHSARTPSPQNASVGARPKITPYASRRAKELGVDASVLRGTGPDGAVVAHDVEEAARSAPPSPAEPTQEQRMRRAIASAMARSKREIPHYYVSHTIDLGPALDWLTRTNASASVQDRMLPIVLLVRAVALALHKVPELNAHWTGEQAPPIPEVHVGLAISLKKGGVIAPAVAGADEVPMPELARRLDDLVVRARAGGLKASELASPTITITSLGDRGVETVTPVIFPPQVAMVGFGKVVTRPFVVDGAIVPRPVVHATLAADHRASDGHRGGLFLAEVEALLLQPERLATPNRPKEKP